MECVVCGFYSVFDICRCGVGYYCLGLVCVGVVGFKLVFIVCGSMGVIDEYGVLLYGGVV